ncbi:Toxoplasma gondii family A protein [Toxoplasma gondii VEG]|uniref:Toxoplasma gondii family A protein n=1 Tax=Toxoplasma gondii (strain ATCC 50861 / VEG) TaxID=432359 RepID=V4ZRE1_TOXGV|nr:Toxoplasma gondii family A protein [Toxoplasma gondii VEG]CEL78778.1 TPA: hypothetical protein BN1205_029025 [Toxoplasma gondii VEG]
MAGQTFPAVYLTLMIGTLLSCAASETKEPIAGTEFTAAIPKGGLEKNVEEIFSLGPSCTLRVIDETGKATYQPETSTNSDGTLTEPYSAAYRYENGACDFTKTIEFKDAFPGYKAKLWIREEQESWERNRESAGKAVKYTFRNPPAEYLSGGLSFCVRFKTVLTAVSDSETRPPTPPTSIPNDTESPESNDQPESDETHQGSGNPGAQPPASEDGSDSPGQGSASSQGGGGTEPTDGLTGSDTHGNPSDSEVHADTLTHPSGPKVPAVNQTQENNLSTPSEAPGGPVGGNGDKGHLSGGTDGVSGKLSRRLSEAAPVKDAFLTVVVHSGSRNFLSGLNSLSIFLVAVGTTLLPVS